MKRRTFVAGAFIFLATLLLAPRAAAAASCYRQSGVYVCDARPSQPAFKAPGYRPGSIFFDRTYAWMEDYAPFYDSPGGKVVEEASAGILYYTIEETATDAAGNTWYRVDERWAKAENMHLYE